MSHRVLCSPVEESSWGPFRTKKQRRCFWMEVYQRLSEFAHTQMEKVWSRTILVHNKQFFLSYSMCACFNVLVLCCYFFSTSVSLFLSTDSVDSVGTTIFTLPVVISSFVFYSYQFDVCLFSNVCQEYVFVAFFFNFMIFFSPQTCVDSAGETIFTFPEVIQLNVFIAVPDHFVCLEQQNFLITRRQCGYLPCSSWKWPENKTNRVRTYLGDKIFSTVAKSVLRSQWLCSCNQVRVFVSGAYRHTQHAQTWLFIQKNNNY